MKKNMLSYALCSVVCALLVSIVNAQETAPQKAPAKTQEDKAAQDAKMEWWREAQYGMFIHWGVYAQYAGFYKGNRGWKYAEHIMHKSRIPVEEYEKTAAQFNPVDFDAKAWVKLAEDAGMRYLVITAKHHDGFCMYDSEYTKYDIIDWTPFKRDPIKELADACKGTQVRFGLYYSHMDWHYTHNKEDYDEYRMNQVAELIEKYDPGVLWFDDYKVRGNQALLKMLTEKYPNVILNERVTTRGTGDGDFECSEQKIREQGTPKDWEACMTINNSWGYHRGDNKWKSTEKLINRLIEVVSKGGNFLLNVGPDSKGVIPEPSVIRLKEVGEWLKLNGEAVYDSEYANIAQTQHIRFTAKPGKLYCFITKWPESGEITAESNDEGKLLKATKAYMLVDSTKAPLTITSTATGGLTVKLPAEPTDPIASVLVIELAK